MKRVKRSGFVLANDTTDNDCPETGLDMAYPMVFSSKRNAKKFAKKNKIGYTYILKVTLPKDDAEKWDNRELGATEEFVKVVGEEDVPF